MEEEKDEGGEGAGGGGGGGGAGGGGWHDWAEFCMSPTVLYNDVLMEGPLHIPRKLADLHSPGNGWTAIFSAPELL